MTRSIALLSLTLVLGACAGKKDAPAADSATPASQPSSQPAAQASESGGEDGVVRRGAPFTVAEETALSDVVARPADFTGKKVKVRGTVDRCCSKKGCWMELRADGGGVRVTFKGYAFFVPLDSAGSNALVEGEVELKTLDEATAEHLAEEGATINRNAAGEAVEVALVATAVELTR